MYGFESGRGTLIIKQNRRLVEVLKEQGTGFLYKDPAERTGLYKHPIIQKIVNKAWFNNSRDEGIVFADLFNPISVETLALVFAAVSS
ncbi:hypothetical protein CPC08DRAFT_700098 [Agrocybe pediades]|nr:hypothetical protein CPC08DRAFT_700098 [Agrocybe pediades]